MTVPRKEILMAYISNSKMILRWYFLKGEFLFRKLLMAYISTVKMDFRIKYPERKW